MKLWRILCFITLVVFSISLPIQAFAFSPLTSPNLGDPPGPPASFNKVAPTNGETGVSPTPTISWEASSQAFSYAYCIDQTNDSVCNSGTWTSTGSSTSKTLGTLSDGVYYWQVRASNTEGTTEANGGTWWSFMVGTAVPPAAFNKVAPTNSQTGVSINPTLSWQSSAGADSYEYCITTTGSTCDTGWVSTGTSTGATIGPLSYNTPYYWQARATNGFGTTEANGGTWWTFTTQINPPDPFLKLSPANGAGGVSIDPTLSWQTSQYAASYRYCIDTSNDNACNGNNWITTTETTVNLSGLLYSTPYYWQVEAVNDTATTPANGGSWFSFTTETIPPPGSFSKSAPANGAPGVVVNPTLSWGASQYAASYRYCIDTSNDNDCDGSNWVTTASTSVSLTGLDYSTPYYWQVEAVNSSGFTAADGGSWWSFTTMAMPAPGAFNKTAPTNGATGVSINPTLSWGTSSDASSYQYCIDTTPDNTCDGAWVGTTNTSASLSGLVYKTSYYWHVRAVNATGTTDSNGGWWSFTTQVDQPGAFNKIAPTNGATGVLTNPTISWEASVDAASYRYCVDTSNNSTCNATWVTTTGTSATLSGLAYNTPFYWQVEAVNGTGTTPANGGSWWSFTTQIAPPGAFSKTAPTNGGTNVDLNPTLSWGASTGAASYEYCLETTNVTSCTGPWTSTGTNTSANLAGLDFETTYYWQVRAVNTVGTVEANVGTWWSFQTKPNKIFYFIPLVLMEP